MLELARTASDLAGALLKKLTTRRDPTLELAGRHFLFSDKHDHYEEIREADEEDERPHVPNDRTLVDLASLAAWVERESRDDLMNRSEDTPSYAGAIYISRAGDSSAVWPYRTFAHEKRNRVSKAFYRAFLPGQRLDPVSLNYRGILEWFDLLGVERLDDYKNHVLAFRSVSATEGRAVKVQSEGAVMTVHTESKDGVKGSAKIPKYLTAKIPFGDPGFQTSVTWRLTVTVQNGAPTFTLAHNESDGAFDRYLAWAREFMKEKTPHGWTLMGTV
jgi:hypothetical protein